MVLTFGKQPLNESCEYLKFWLFGPGHGICLSGNDRQACQFC